MAASAREMGIDRGERSAELIVQLVRETASGGLLGFEHAEGDAAELAGLRFHLFKNTRGDAHGDARREQGDQQTSAQQQHGIGDETLRLAVHADPRFDRAGVARIDQPGDHAGDVLVHGEQVARGRARHLAARKELPRFRGEIENGALQAVPGVFVRSALRGGDQAMNFAIGLIEIGEHAAAIDLIGRTGDLVEGGVENLLFALDFIDQADDDQLALDQTGGAGGEGAGVVHADDRRGHQQRDHGGEPDYQNAFGASQRYKVELRPHSLVLSVTGACLLWVGWFGFNAGSALSAGSLATSAFVATHFGAAAATLGWMFAEWIGAGKPSVLGAASGAVAGLVAITPASGFVKPGPALIIGFAAGW